MGDVPSRFVRTLSASEREDLKRLRGRHPRTFAACIEVILLSAHRLSVSKIMRRLGVSRPTVTSWLTRFEEAGVPGLLPRSRSGRPAKLTPDELRHVATAVSAQPRALGVDGTGWTLSRLRWYLIKAGVVPAISVETLRLALRKAGISLTIGRTRLI